VDQILLRSNRVWWVGGAVLAVAIFVLLAGIADPGGPGGAGEDLAPGESEVLRARVVEVLLEDVIEQGDFSQPYQHLMLRFTSGTPAGQEVMVEHGVLVATNQDWLFRQGDQVLVEHTRSIDGEDFFQITDRVRTGPLLWLTLLFVAATVSLSGWQGVRSLVGMGIGLVTIFFFIVPQILEGRNPVLIAILGSVVMMGISLYLVYGWKDKTHVAVAGLFASLVLTGLLAVWFVNWSKLSGFGAEEAAFLQVAGVQLDTRGLLLAGIIIGTLGAMDDIAIGQSSSIFELAKANPNLDMRSLFRHGMTIGRDHIAAMVNTLLLAYVGAALPLVLLFTVYSESVGITVNREIVTEEIVRTLVGSLGLLGGVPLTTIIAALVARRTMERGNLVEG
jgi:uncharacterized membrane protein